MEPYISAFELSTLLGTALQHLCIYNKISSVSSLLPMLGWRGWEMGDTKCTLKEASSSCVINP